MDAASDSQAPVNRRQRGTQQGHEPTDDAIEVADLNEAEDAGLEDEASTSYWLSDPPEGFGRQLSHFGRTYSALDGWVTHESLQHIASCAYRADDSLAEPSAVGIQVHPTGRLCSLKCLLACYLGSLVSGQKPLADHVRIFCPSMMVRSLCVSMA
jgi:hypothetical protein